MVAYSMVFSEKISIPDSLIIAFFKHVSNGNFLSIFFIKKMNWIILK